jgi:hypothetical protein
VAFNNETRNEELYQTSNDIGIGLKAIFEMSSQKNAGDSEDELEVGLM